MPSRMRTTVVRSSVAALALLTTIAGMVDPSVGAGVRERVRWGPAVTLAENGDEVAVSVAPDGTATAVWSDERKAVVAARRPPGRPWGEPVRIGTGLSPEVDTDGRGNVTVVWAGAGRGSRFWAARRPAGRAWRDPVAISDAFPVLSEDCHAAAHGDLAVSARGAVAVAWEWGSLDCNVAYRVDVAYRPAGGSWRDPVRVHRGDSAFGYPRSQVALDARGQVFLAYAGDDGTVKVARRPRGHGWIPATTLGRGDWPRLAVNRSGAAVVAWQTERGRLKAAVRRPGGPWRAPRTLLDQVDFTGYTATIDGHGAATVAALERTSPRRTRLVALRHRLPDSWTHPVRLARPGGPPLARTNDAGDVIVAWVGQRGLKAAYRPRAGHWEVARTVARRVGFSFDLGLSASGDATVVWTRNGRVKARTMTVR